LLFRELKTQYELDEFDTSNPAVVEILVYAVLAFTAREPSFVRVSHQGSR